MAAPNISALTTITGAADGYSLTSTSATVVLNCSAGASEVRKLNTLIVANDDGSAGVDVTVSYHNADDIGGTAFAIASTVNVLPDTSIVVIDKNSYIYLEEDTSVSVAASAASDIDVLVSYEIIKG